MHHVPHFRRDPNGLSEVNIMVESDVPALLVLIVKGHKRAGDIRLAVFDIPLLPRPPGAVNVRVVEVEDGVSGCSVASVFLSASNKSVDC